MVTDSYLENLIYQYAGKHEDGVSPRSFYSHATCLSTPDIEYYVRQAKRYVEAKKRCEEAEQKRDWTARSIACRTMEVVKSRFRELVNSTPNSK